MYSRLVVNIAPFVRPTITAVTNVPWQYPNPHRSIGPAPTGRWRKSVAASTDWQAVLPPAADLSTSAYPVGAWTMVLPIVDKRQRTRGPGLPVLALAKNEWHPWTCPLTLHCLYRSLFGYGGYPVSIHLIT